MPRAKNTQPPKSYPAFEHVRRSKFRFNGNQLRKLAELLPYKLASSDAPSKYAATAPGKIKTLADVAIRATEEAINSHLTACPLIAANPVTPANVRAAIRRLRAALRPFVVGWVDDETADITDWRDLDAKLEVRDQRLAQSRLSSAQREALAHLCSTIANDVLGQILSEIGEAAIEYDILRYLDAALSFARIEHPDLQKHRKRLSKLVFLKEEPSH